MIRCYFIRMKITTFIVAGALSLTSLGQEVEIEQPWKNGQSKTKFFISGGYGFASEGAASGEDIYDDFINPIFGEPEDFLYSPGNNVDAINIDNLVFVEFGLKKSWEYFNLVFSAEFLFSRSEIDELDRNGFNIEYESKNFGGTVNIKGEFQPSRYVSFYAGAGIGALDHTIDYRDDYGATFSGEETVLIWQATAGIELKPIEQVGIFVQYRYLAGEDFEGLDITTIKDSFVDVGTRFYF